MSTVSPALSLDVRPGAPAILRVGRPADLAAWCAEHRDVVRAAVTDSGAVLVRGLGLADADAVGTAFRALATDLMAEEEAFAPRQRLADGLYSATPWPANQQMCMHSELSYAAQFPSLLLFACLTAPEAGGATPVADAPTVLEALPAELTGRFEREGWLLLRTYNDEIGASIEEAFGSADPAVVEEHCRAQAIEFQWQPDGGLRTRQRRPAVVRHPRTGERCWFNQIAFLNEWTLAPEIREYLVDVYGPDGLPFTTAYGDGEPIGEDVVALINRTYEDHTRREPWQAGDLLLVDNIRTAHGREPYTGPREVLAGLAERVRAADLASGSGR